MAEKPDLTNVVLGTNGEIFGGTQQKLPAHGSGPDKLVANRPTPEADLIAPGSGLSGDYVTLSPEEIQARRAAIAGEGGDDV